MRASRLLPIFLIVLVDVFGMTLVIPLLAIYAERFGATPFQAGLLFSIYATCQLLAGPVLGRASDRFGRKPLLVLSQLGTLVGFVVMARAHSLWVLYLARVIDGATAGNLTIAQAYLSDHTAPENRAKSFALIGIAFGLGFFVGPFLTGTLVHYGLNAPIWAAAGLSLTSIVCTLTLLPGGMLPGADPQAAAAPGPAGRRLPVLEWRAYAPYFARPVLGGLLWQFFCFMFSFSVFTSGFTLFAERALFFRGHSFGPREVGYLFAYVGFLGIVLQGGLIGRLIRRFGEPSLVVSGFASIVAGYAALALVHRVGPLVVVATVTSFGNGVLRPVLTSLVSQHARRDEQGVVLGLTQSLGSLASILAPAVGGVLIDRGWLPLWALLACAAAAVGLGMACFGPARAAAVRNSLRPPAR